MITHHATWPSSVRWRRLPRPRRVPDRQDHHRHRYRCDTNYPLRIHQSSTPNSIIHLHASRPKTNNDTSFSKFRKYSIIMQFVISPNNFSFFFFNDPPPPEISPFPLHDPFPI